MFGDDELDQRAAAPYLYPPVLSSVEPTCTQPPAWSVPPEAPCHAWLPDLLRRGWRIGPARPLPPYFTARRLFGSPTALVVAGVLSVLIALFAAWIGAGVFGAVLAFVIGMAGYTAGHLLWAVATRPSREEWARPPQVLWLHARDAQEYAPPPSSPEGQRLNAAVKAIRHIEASPAWRAPIMQAWSHQLELDLAEEWSEVRYRVGRICEIRAQIERASDMSASIRRRLNSQIEAILNATDIRVRALVDYSAGLRQVEGCLRALHDSHIGEALAAELSELLVETAGDSYVAESTHRNRLDLEATQTVLRSALKAMSDQADLLRTHGA